MSGKTEWEWAEGLAEEEENGIDDLDYKLSKFSQQEDQVAGYDYSSYHSTGGYSRRTGAGAGDFLRNHHRSSWAEDREDASKSQIDKEKLDRCLSQIATVVNAVRNSATGRDKKLYVKWSNGSEKNSVKSNTLVLSPDDILNAEDEAKAVDSLCAKGMQWAYMKKTCYPAQYNKCKQGEETGSEIGKNAARMYKAAEEAVARQTLLDGWGGYSPFFDVQDELSKASKKKEIEDWLESGDPSSAGASVIAAWDMLHPKDKITDARYKEVGPLLKEIKLRNKSKRYDAFKDLAEKLVKIYDEEEDDEDDEGDGEANEDDKGGGEEASDSEPNPSDEEGAEPRKPPVGPEPKVIDDSLFDEDIENTTSKEAGDEDEQEMANVKDTSDLPELHGAAGCYGTLVVEPIVSAYHTDRYKTLVNECKPITKMLSKYLNFRNDAEGEMEHGMPIGDLDEGSLYKAAFETVPKIWESRQEKSHKEVAISILIDQSGSMNSYASDTTFQNTSGRGRYLNRANLATRVGVICSEAFDGVPGVETIIVGHETNAGPGRVHRSRWKVRYAKGKRVGKGYPLYMKVYKDKSIPKPDGLTSLEAGCENMDGHAMEWAARHLAEQYPDVRHRYLFLISDGSPNCNSAMPRNEGVVYHYGGPESQEHMKSVVDWSRRKLGIPIYGIGIDDAYETKWGDAVYGEGRHVVLKDTMGSIGVLGGFLKRELGKL